MGAVAAATSATAEDISDYQTVPILTQELKRNLCYFSYTWVAQIIKGVLHFDISFTCWFWVIRVLVHVF